MMELAQPRDRAAVSIAAKDSEREALGTKSEKPSSAANNDALGERCRQPRNK